MQKGDVKVSFFIYNEVKECDYMLDSKLIEYLNEQIEQGYKFLNIDKFELAFKLLENIGIEDPYLRDELIYPNLSHLLHDSHLNEEQLTKLTEELISDKYLHFDLDNDIEYSVLIRSFSLLQLVVLVYVHNRDGLSQNTVIKNVYDRFMDYFNKEQNLTGYSEEYGFLHSIAHSADLFSQLAKLKEFKENELLAILTAISKKFKTKEYFFMHDEDERMVHAIWNILERDLLSKDLIIAWINDFGTYRKIDKYPDAYFLTNNIKNLLRSLYFRLLEHEKYEDIVAEIKVVLKEKVGLR